MSPKPAQPFGVVTLDGIQYIERPQIFTMRRVINSANQEIKNQNLTLPGEANFLLKGLTRDMVIPPARLLEMQDPASPPREPPPPPPPPPPAAPEQEEEDHERGRFHLPRRRNRNAGRPPEAPPAEQPAERPAQIQPAVPPIVTPAVIDPNKWPAPKALGLPGQTAAGGSQDRRFRFRLHGAQGTTWFFTGGLGIIDDYAIDTLVFGSGQFIFPLIPPIPIQANGSIVFDIRDMGLGTSDPTYYPYTIYFAFHGTYLYPVQ